MDNDSFIIEGSWMITEYLGTLIKPFDGTQVEQYHFRNGQWIRKDVCPIFLTSIVSIDVVYDPVTNIYVPCVLCVNEGTEGGVAYRIVQWNQSMNTMDTTYTYQPTHIQTVDVAMAIISCGLQFLFTNTMIIDLSNNLDLTQLPKTWHFDWSMQTPGRLSVLVIQQVETGLQYQLISLLESVIDSKILTHKSFIPSEYDKITVCINIYWRIVIRSNGRGLVRYPVFVIGTSYNQILVFEEGKTMCCIQLNELPLHLKTMKVSSKVFVVTAHLKTGVVIYKLTQDFDGPYQLRSLLWQQVESVKHVLVGDFLSIGHQQMILLKCDLKDNCDYILTDFNDYKNHVKPGPISLSLEDNSSLTSACRALEIRKLHGEVQVDEQKRVLQHKYDVLQHGFEVLKHIPCYDNKPMKIRQDHSTMCLIPGEVDTNTVTIQSTSSVDLKLLDHWQRIVDGRLWTIGLLVKNEGQCSACDISFSLLSSSQDSISSQNKMISLDHSPHYISTIPAESNITLSSETYDLLHNRTLPSGRTGCFVVSASLSENVPPIQAIIIATWCHGNKDMSRHSSMIHSLSFDMEWIWSEQLKCPSLHDLPDWKGVGYIGLDTGTMDNKKWLNLISHLGCKLITRFQMTSSHTSLHCIPMILSSELPHEVTITSPYLKQYIEKTQPTCTLLQGVGIYYDVNTTKDIATISILHSCPEQVNILKEIIRKILPSDINITEFIDEYEMREGLKLLTLELKQ